MMTKDYSVFSAIDSLISYGLKVGLIDAADEIYARNSILAVLGIDEYIRGEENYIPFPDCLNVISDHAVEKQLIADTAAMRDLLDTRVMGLLTPRPSQVISEFGRLYSNSPAAATDYFYALSKSCNYIRCDRIARDEHWTAETAYGELEISINLSKPEKDPRDIAAAKTRKASGYPMCLLCIENEGYAGTVSHPARENLRIIPVDICGEKWGFQYSPYVYYNEHCIVMNSRHVPMTIDGKVFRKLFSFVEKFPHYFIGSNADLPIVGGSILSHEHFQGGRHCFPMEKAGVDFDFCVSGFEDVRCSVLRYPMTVLRLSGEGAEPVCLLAERILNVWRGYSDPEYCIFAETDGEMHNTITPIARMRDGKYELDLVLRNNITTAEHPLGLFHPHAQLHHIKKENIGLIEVMGLAILPGRLKTEMEELKRAILSGYDVRSIPELEKHADWVDEFLPRHPDFSEENADSIIRAEIGNVFAQVLECAGVYKATENGRKGLRRFLGTLS